MPDIKDQRPTEYNARSLRHQYINIPPDRPVEEADIRCIWQNHTVDANGNFLAMREGGVDYSLQFGAIQDSVIAPGNGLPPMPVKAIAAYLRQFAYDTLPEFESKTGAFAPPLALPEQEPTE